MQNVSPDLREHIINEFRFAAVQIAGASRSLERVYYWSATFGALLRAYNIDFDPELVYAHQILNTVHAQLQGRLAAITAGDAVVPLSDELWQKLSLDIVELADCWEKGRPIDGVLRHITLLGYATTGNGYYLYLKGKLTF